ncbi:MAG: hypothetical protein WBH47_12335 [Streptosporangiaceae bacterium]
MSVTTRKQPLSTSNGLSDRVARAGRPVGTLAGKTVPLAQTAGTTVRQGAGTAIAKATPAVDAARSWAAPQLEQSAHAITDSIAPMISEALITAAHKIDVPKPKKRIRGGMVAGAVALLAAAGAATFAAIRMRRQDTGFAADAAETSAPSAESGLPEEPGPDPDADGHSRIV